VGRACHSLRGSFDWWIRLRGFCMFFRARSQATHDGNVPPEGRGVRWSSLHGAASTERELFRRALLLIPELCPGGQRQKLTLNKSTRLV